MSIDQQPDGQRTTPSLWHSSKVLLRAIPRSSVRSVRIAMVLAFALAAMEFLAIFLLYPVFTYLTAADSSGSFTLPILGITTDRSGVRWLAILALTLMILRSSLTLLYRRWWLGVTAQAETQLSDRLIRAYAYAPYAFHLDKQSTDLMTRTVSHVNIACTAGLVGIVGIVSDAFLVLGLAAALVLANPIAGLVVTAYVALLALLYLRVTRGMTRRLTAELDRRTRITYRRVSTLLRGIREITVFGLRERNLQQISQSRTEMTEVSRRVLLLQDIPRAVLEVTLYSTILIALVVLLGLRDPDTVLPLVALYVIAGLRIMPTLARMLGNFANARTGTQMAEVLVDEMATLDQLTEVTVRTEPIASHRAELTLADVRFRYQPDEADVIKDLNLHLPFGSFLGIVGESGAGKTTLTSMILGLLPPTQGSITYGSDPVIANDAEWFDRVAVVPQDVFLTPDSLQENILAGRPLDQERLSWALAQAGIADLPSTLAEGLQTEMLEGGARLSAGQRQRVGLARALYRHPEILVLDEPTSALDASTEAHIVASLADLRGAMTIVVVAHRLHTLVDADLVLALSRTRPYRIGPPNEVLVGL